MALIFLGLLTTNYFKYERGVTFCTYLMLCLVTLLLFERLKVKRLIKIIVVSIISLLSVTIYESGHKEEPRGITFIKELHGVVQIGSLKINSFTEKRSKRYTAKFVKLDQANRDLLKKEIIIRTDIHSNMKLDTYYCVKGKLGFCNINANELIFNLNSCEEISLYNKHSNIFFYNIKINSSNQAFLKAFVFGDKSELTREQKIIFRNSGTMHLFAVSGLHVGCLYFAIYFLFKCLNLKYYYRIVSTMIVLFGYLYLVDFSVSSTRAYIMLLMWSLSKLLGIKPISYNLVCATGVVLLLMDPENIISIGFILSVSVVLSILWMIDNIHLTIKSNFISKFLQMCLVNYAAFWGSFVVLAKVFSIIIPVSLLSNLILIPLVSILMPFSFVGLILLQFSFLSFLSPVFEWPMYQIIKICTLFSDFTWSIIPFSIDSNTYDFGHFLVVGFFVLSFGFLKNTVLKLLLLPTLFVAFLLI